jgi:hypothetical protein
MGPRNAYKDMLDNVVSPITCVSMNHQNQLEQMANGAMFATVVGDRRWRRRRRLRLPRTPPVAAVVGVVRRRRRQHGGALGVVAGSVLMSIGGDCGLVRWACLNRALRPGDGRARCWQWFSRPAVAVPVHLCLWPSRAVTAWSGWGRGLLHFEQWLR